ncbi:hypothetical protein [Pseudomonas sp.]|uniref:hypothetical protein n=1 Tax=Pseudomonas sp. TaxID=306 RepID=UPI00258E6692|nr:hypothetical protein [Pseudomonas sp.]
MDTEYLPAYEAPKDILSLLIFGPSTAPDANLHPTFSAVVTTTRFGFREDDHLSTTDIERVIHE